MAGQAASERGSAPDTGGCPDASALVELADGELAEPEAERARVHLGECDVCRRVVARLVAVRRATHDEHGGESGMAEPGIDSLVADRYRIVRVLGRGGMGTVFEAWDPVLERRVALKVLHARSLGDPDQETQRLLRESRALARLRHPNVVAVHDVGSSGGRPYLAMEYVAGETLRRWLAKSERSWAQVLAVFVQAGRGLAAAHAVGLVHRDFKPDNVIICEGADGGDERALVLDFGLVRTVADPSASDEAAPGVGDARHLGTLTESGRLVGTPAYMAPEQFRGGDIDARADVFAFCTALYEALFGVRPFAGRDPTELQLAIEAGTPQRPASSRDVPAWLERAVVRGLAADRARRPADLRALLDELRVPRSRRRWAWLGLGLVPVAVLALALREQEPTDVRCDGDPLATTWSDAERSRVASATAASEEVLARIDGHAAALRRHWTAACELRTADHALAELELGCLEGRRHGLAAIVELIAAGDVSAAGALAGLPPADDCVSDRLLVQLVPLPSEPVRRREVESIRAELTAVRVLHEAGRSDDAAQRLTALEPRMTAVDYPPLFAEATYIRSLLAMAKGDLDSARAALVESAQLATAADYDALGAVAWVDLIVVASDFLRDFPRAHEYAGNARAAIARLPPGPARDELEARMGVHMGALLRHEGRTDEARTAFARSLELAEAMAASHESPHYDEFVADALEGLALVHGDRGELDEALTRYEQVLELRMRLLGADHPRTAMTLANLGGLERDAGRPERALEHNRAARQSYERVIGADTVEFAIALGNEASVLGQLGRLDEALAAYDRTIEILAGRTDDPGGYLALRMRQSRAQVLVTAGRAVEGIAALEPVCAAYEAMPERADAKDGPQCREELARAKAKTPG